jgi:hypothetical protein
MCNKVNLIASRALEFSSKAISSTANRQRFREAAAYAKQLLSDLKVRVTYVELAAKQGIRASEVAISEYLQKQKQS